MPFRSSIRVFVSAIALVALVGAFGFRAVAQSSPAAAASQELPSIKVYKSPTCGCCSKWVDHLREEGFNVETTDMPDMNAVKVRYGVPRTMLSCHTAVVGEYVVEGHVPAEDIKRLLAEKPDVAGLAVPNMPIGSPGMEQGDRQDPYDVIAFGPEGKAEVFAQHNQ